MIPTAHLSLTDSLVALDSAAVALEVRRAVA
jgi:hypothetical protein